MPTSEQLIQEEAKAKQEKVIAKAQEVGKILLSANLTISEITQILQIIQNTVNSLSINVNFDEKKPEEPKA